MTVLTTLLPGFAGTTLPDWLAARLRAGLGGVCLFGPNITSPTQLRALTDAIHAANPRALIALDEEGGDVTRLFAAVGSPSPGNAVLGRIDDVAVTQRDAVEIGWELRRAGCNVNFAPSVDINSNPDNPVIGVRSFGGSAELVARHGAAWVTGLQSTGVAATAKHFPGHGDTAQDSHLALPVVDRSPAELRERELRPFVTAIAAGTRLVMTSHILLPQLDAEVPATMSRAILLDLLRGELGFTGVIVSDALDMAGARRFGDVGEVAVRSLHGGCDLLCLGTDNTDAELTAIERAVEAAIDGGSLDVGRVADAANRVLALAEDLERSRPPFPDAAAARPELAPHDLIRTFDISPAARAWRTGASSGYAVVRLEARPNSATGPTPWGPFPAAADPTSEADRQFARQLQFEVTAGHAELPPDLPATAVLVVGRDIHLHPFARTVVDRLRSDRADRADVLVVDLGWPSDDRRYADVATFGSSRLVGRALLEFLAGADGDRGASP